MNLLKASQTTVYAVGLVEHQGSYRNELRMRLQQMVDATGGQAFFPSALKDLDSSYEKVLQEIKAQYYLGYVPTNATQDGSWRKVEIKLKKPRPQAPHAQRATSRRTRNAPKASRRPGGAASTRVRRPPLAQARKDPPLRRPCHHVHRAERRAATLEPRAATTSPAPSGQARARRVGAAAACAGLSDDRRYVDFALRSQPAHRARRMNPSALP